MPFRCSRKATPRSIKQVRLRVAVANERCFSALLHHVTTATCRTTRTGYAAPIPRPNAKKSRLKRLHASPYGFCRPSLPLPTKLHSSFVILLLRPPPPPPRLPARPQSCIVWLIWCSSYAERESQTNPRPTQRQEEGKGRVDIFVSRASWILLGLVLETTRRRLDQGRPRSGAKRKKTAVGCAKVLLYSYSSLSGWRTTCSSSTSLHRFGVLVPGRLG